jgi:hypothetical protein
MISASGTALNRITLTWQSKDSTSTPTNGCPAGASNVFSPTDTWTCGYGVLRVDLVRTDGTYDYAGLMARNMTTFLVPLNAGVPSSAPYVPGGGNNLIGTGCSNANCTFTFSGLATNQYYMRISSAYKHVSLKINAFDASGNPLGLKDAEALIDATGKAQDVLRRIQVHVPLTPSSQNQTSDYGLESTDSICKRFVVMDNYFDTQVNGVTSNNPLCQSIP